MKKLLSLLLSLALILTLAACGSSPDAPSVPTDDITDVGVTEIATETTGDSADGTTSESVITETVTQTVTDASGKPVTEADGKPVTTVVTTIITTRPTYGTGSASASAPRYTGTPIGHPTDNSTSKSAGNSTSKSTGNSTNTSTTATTTTAKIPSISIGGIIINTTNVTMPTTSATTKAVTEDQRLVDSLFTLSTGQSKSGVTLTGVVTNVEEVSQSHGNATFDLQVQGVTQQKTIYCYRVTPVDVTQLQVQEGQTLILTGKVQNYKGTIEFHPATYQIKGGTAVTTTQPISSGAIDKNGIYDSKNDVALYIHTYGCLPKNYVTKSQYNKDKYLCVGGDRFYNKEGRLPAGETYYECDIDTYGTTNRGAKRLVWTKSGIVYYTADHYETFTKLYGAR